jgi:hypothetical protein
MLKTKLKYVIPTFFTCFSKFSPRSRAPKGSWAGATPSITLGTEPCPKVGRSSPSRCFARVQIDRRAMCNFLSFGHLPNRQGEREGDG